MRVKPISGMCSAVWANRWRGHIGVIPLRVHQLNKSVKAADLLYLLITEAKGSTGKRLNRRLELTYRCCHLSSLIQVVCLMHFFSFSLYVTHKLKSLEIFALQCSWALRVCVSDLLSQGALGCAAYVSRLNLNKVLRVTTAFIFNSLHYFSECVWQWWWGSYFKMLLII